MTLILARGGRNPHQAGGAWTTEHIYTLDADAAGDAGCGYRVIVPALSKNITKLRLTVKAYAAGTTIADHVAVGIRSSDDDCTTIPTEVTFSSNAVHGFNIANGATLLSDEIIFAASAGNDLLLPVDLNASNGGVAYNDLGGLCYRLTATASWNTATANMVHGGGGIQQGVISRIEVFG